MSILGLCLISQLFLAFGIAGLLWPEKFMPVVGVLMFPWPANWRLIRANGVMAIGAYVLIIGRFLIRAF